MQPYYLYLQGTVDESMMRLVAHKRSVVRCALDDVEPDPDSETKAFMADVIGAAPAQAEQEVDQAAQRIRTEAAPRSRQIELDLVDF